MKKILMILTSHEDMEYTTNKTGVWLGEVTEPYYEFVDKGYEVVLASPKGGEPPIDPMSTMAIHMTGSNLRFYEDKIALIKFENTLKLEEVNCAEFDSLFIPGGHGPIWDLATNTRSGQIILEFLSAEKPVGAVCHGTAALIKAAELQPGLLTGKRVTGFTNTEEAWFKRSDNVPYKLQTRLKGLGADFHSALIPFSSHVEKDGFLITGQNPVSAGPTAKAVLKALEAVHA